MIMSFGDRHQGSIESVKSTTAFFFPLHASPSLAPIKSQFSIRRVAETTVKEILTGSSSSSNNLDRFINEHGCRNVEVVVVKGQLKNEILFPN